MKITVNLTANLSIDNLEAKGFQTNESQKNWDNDRKMSHGRQRENRVFLEGLSGSAKADFGLKIDFDMKPEEMQSCYSCIEQLVQTVADSHHQTAEAVKTATFEHQNTDVEEKVSQFMREARHVRETKDAGVTYALLLGHEAIAALKKNDVEGKNAGTIADIQGIMDSLRKRIHNADDHIV